MKLWSVYLLRNERGALYTGISNDPERRLAEHRSGASRGARYTRACKSLAMVYCCEVGSRGVALKIESRIKKMKKARKEELVLSRPDRRTLLVQLGMADLDEKRESLA
ncbi:MAG TPA: GIY-YIG nuclease family protein [Geopsychrobacteraceae bacterium]|nr:GIY-YIG nuclease family protein [Geopsychrobacteraceae bacterium]